jgi:hypothetical protein
MHAPYQVCCSEAVTHAGFWLFLAQGLEGVKARLLQLISWKSLPARCQDAARNVLVRLESKNRKAPPISLMTLLLLPPAPVAAFPDP